MHTIIPLYSIISTRVRSFLVLIPLVVLAPALFAAQAPSTPASSAKVSPVAAHKSAKSHKHSAKAQTSAASAQAAPVTPPAPDIPKWPANEKPVVAKVTWDSHGLRIEAANSSLSQILEDVATATGTQVQGFEKDERIFGIFGPGPAREVLSQLLLGSGYNVVMVGDLGVGTPREIQLSFRRHETAKAAPNNAPASDDDADSEDQPQPVGRPGFGPGGQPNLPHQMPQRPMPEQPPSNPQ
jgi:hypothetical protein